VINVSFEARKRTAKVSPFTLPPAGMPGLFLVKGSGSKNPSHAELNLTHVLKTFKAGSAGVVYVAGTKRACQECGGALVDTLASGYDLRFSEHFGKLWKDQLNFHASEQQKLLAAYLALAHPVFEKFIAVGSNIVAVPTDDESDSEDEDIVDRK
jgi:hypothetical protein